MPEADTFFSTQARPRSSPIVPRDAMISLDEVEARLRDLSATALMLSGVEEMDSPTRGAFSALATGIDAVLVLLPAPWGRC